MQMITSCQQKESMQITVSRSISMTARLNDRAACVCSVMVFCDVCVFFGSKPSKQTLAIRHKFAWGQKQSIIEQMKYGNEKCSQFLPQIKWTQTHIHSTKCGVASRGVQEKSWKDTEGERAKQKKRQSKKNVESSGRRVVHAMPKAVTCCLAAGR